MTVGQSVQDSRRVSLRGQQCSAEFGPGWRDRPARGRPTGRRPQRARPVGRPASVLIHLQTCPPDPARSLIRPGRGPGPRPPADRRRGLAQVSAGGRRDGRRGRRDGPGRLCPRPGSAGCRSGGRAYRRPDGRGPVGSGSIESDPPDRSAAPLPRRPFAQRHLWSDRLGPAEASAEPIRRAALLGIRMTQSGRTGGRSPRTGQRSRRRAVQAVGGARRASVSARTARSARASLHDPAWTQRCTVSIARPCSPRRIASSPGS